jgi:hypothetical protein
MGVGALNAVLVYRVARARLGTIAGVAGGLFYAVWGPAVFAERTTLLEPWVNLGVLTSLLLLGDPRTTSRRRLVLAGAALGLATTVKVWAVVPLLVLLCWLALRRRRAALQYAAGAVAAATVVCLPFFIAAPSTMFRLVVLDQLGRGDFASPTWQARLVGITAARDLDQALPYDAAQGSVVLFALMLAAVVVAARRTGPARPWCALFAAQSAVLLTGPTFFPHYATYVAPALALVVAATAHEVCRALSRAGTWLTPVAATAGLAVAVPLLVATGLRTEGWPAPSHDARARLSAADCVAADAPATLQAADLLVRNLRRDCPVLVDPTGVVYDQRSAHQPADTLRHSRSTDVAWQRFIGRWFAGSQAIIVQHGNPSGFSPETLRAFARGRTASSHQRYEVYVAPDLPLRGRVEAAAP